MRIALLTLAAALLLSWDPAVARLSTGLSAGLPAGLSAPLNAQQSDVTVFAGMRLVTGAGAPSPNGVIVVQGGRVIAAGPSASVKAPAAADRVWLTGKTVIPGLVNAHGHVGDTEGLEGNHYSAEHVRRDLRLYAAYGVTTVFSLGGDEAPSFAARDAQRTPPLDRARIYVAGPVLAPTSPENARSEVARVAAMKADIVKIRVDDNLGTTPKMKPEIYRAVIDEAHLRGMRVAVHIFYLDDAKALLDAGADFIAHSVRDRLVDQAFIDKLKARSVCYSPTLMREISTYIYQSTPEFFNDPFFVKYADPQVVAGLKEPARQKAVHESPAAQKYRVGLEVAERNLKILSDAGVTIAMGTDTGPPGRFQGYFEQLELAQMAKTGMNPLQVLNAATGDAARCMQIDKEVGTLEPGKWADFVVLDRDPLVDVRNTRRIDAVYIAGRAIQR